MASDPPGNKAWLLVRKNHLRRHTWKLRYGILSTSSTHRGQLNLYKTKTKERLKKSAVITHNTEVRTSGDTKQGVFAFSVSTPDDRKRRSGKPTELHFACRAAADRVAWMDEITRIVAGLKLRLERPTSPRSGTGTSDSDSEGESDNDPDPVQVLREMREPVGGLELGDRYCDSRKAS